jgi:hypothetical protein
LRFTVYGIKIDAQTGYFSTDEENHQHIDFYFPGTYTTGRSTGECCSASPHTGTGSCDADQQDASGAESEFGTGEGNLRDKSSACAGATNVDFAQ